MGDDSVVGIDFSAIEARVLKTMLEEDPHRKRAAKEFGVAEAQVTPQQRQYAKRLNHMEIYGSITGRHDNNVELVNGLLRLGGIKK